jgi:hypothetical protein
MLSSAAQLWLGGHETLAVVAMALLPFCCLATQGLPAQVNDFEI